MLAPSNGTTKEKHSTKELLTYTNYLMRRFNVCETAVGYLKSMIINKVMVEVTEIEAYMEKHGRKP